MNVALTPELEELVRYKVQSGLYPSPDDVIREGLRLLRERDDGRLGFPPLEDHFPDVIADDDSDPASTYDEHGLKKLIDRITADGRKTRRTV